MKIYEAHPRLKDERELKIWSLERAIASSLLEGMEEAVKPLEEELQQMHRLCRNGWTSTIFFECADSSNARIQLSSGFLIILCEREQK